MPAADDEFSFHEATPGGEVAIWGVTRLRRIGPPNSTYRGDRPAIVPASDVMTAMGKRFR
jgi:hypothetical protein